MTGLVIWKQGWPPSSVLSILAFMKFIKILEVQNTIRLCPPEDLQGGFWPRKHCLLQRCFSYARTCAPPAKPEAAAEGCQAATSVWTRPGREAGGLRFPAFFTLCLVSTSYLLLFIFFLFLISHILFFSFYGFFLFFNWPFYGTKVNFIDSII